MSLCDTRNGIAAVVGDVSDAVNRVKLLSSGHLSKAQMLIAPNAPDPTGSVTVLSVSNVVDAVKGFGYPFSGPCACPSAVPCLFTQLCDTTADCPTGQRCMYGFLCAETDACGRCTPPPD